MSARNEERKDAIYNFINEYIRENGVSPTTNQISVSLDLAKSTVSKYVNRLYDEGLIEKNGRYGMLTAENLYPSYRMPIIGSIACGKPRLAEEDIKGYIPLDRSFGRGEFFGLVAEGDSMTDVGISEGDIVYVKRQSTADDGDIVVAMTEDSETGEARATLKRFFRDRENKRYILHPENKAMSDIIVSEVTILGVALRVLKNLEN